MGWQDLLSTNSENLISAPWVGGRVIQTPSRKWKIKGNLPPEHGWYQFDTQDRTASVKERLDFPEEEVLSFYRVGFLVGNRLVPDNIPATIPLEKLAHQFQRVHLIEPGLDRFARIKAGRTWEKGPLIYQEEEFPLGPEEQVLEAFLDKKESISDIPGVTPALQVAFDFEVFVRNEAERRRQEEEERRRREELRRQMQESLGNSTLRREMARQDFGEAARSALSLGGAEYLDHREGAYPNEMIVKYRTAGIRLECTCHRDTLAILDSGICLTEEHGNGEFSRGTQGDTWLSLESLPSVVNQANREGLLVVYRHG